MKRIIVAAALSALVAPAYADLTVNGKLSTLGSGLEVAFPLPVLTSTDARFGFNTFSYGFQQTTTSGGNSTDYDGDLNLQSLQALVDWHPFAGSFRMSGGVVYNGNKFSMTARPTNGQIAVGGGTYFPAGNAAVNATVDFSKVVPYLGFGFGRTPKNTGLSFTSDIGIMFQGSPNATVTTTGIPDAGNLAADTAQAKADLEAALKNFTVYPVISFGIGYTF